MGLEPTRQRHWNLNPARLPIPPLARPPSLRERGKKRGFEDGFFGLQEMCSAHAAPIHRTLSTCHAFHPHGLQLMNWTMRAPSARPRSTAPSNCSRHTSRSRAPRPQPTRVLSSLNRAPHLSHPRDALSPWTRFLTLGMREGSSPRREHGCRGRPPGTVRRRPLGSARRG